jgi:hypothetical protein
MPWCSFRDIPLFLSTAEVESVFSQVKLVKCDHINRMKQVTMNNILHVNLNCNKQCYEHVSDTVVANTAAVLIKCMLLLGYSADKPSFSFNKSLRHAMMLLSWHSSIFITCLSFRWIWKFNILKTCQTKLQQTMLWACVRYSSCQVF